MNTTRLWRGVVPALVVAALGTGCFVGATPTVTDACVPGSYDVHQSHLTGALAAAVGDLTFTGSPGADLTLGPDSTWQLTADGTNPLTVSGTSPYGPVTGTLTIAGTAYGVYGNIDSAQLVFTLRGVTGTAHLALQVGGKPVDLTVGADAPVIKEAFAPSGVAHYACSADGLALSFPVVDFSLDRG